MFEKYVKRSIAVLAVMIAALSLLNYRDILNFAKSIQVFSESSGRTKSGELTVVIDAGHGGDDPGKIGVNQAEEKDINLAIANKLKKNLSHQGIRVVMTRENESGLYSSGSKNKKREDMNKRVEIINSANADLTVSIHQNSFTDGQYKGAQVFYYTGSEEGELLAETLQDSLIENADRENHRVAKANSDYFILKNAKVPTVIVECGFLSNAEEAQKLCDDAYQEKIAWAVHLGILRYLNEREG